MMISSKPSLAAEYYNNVDTTTNQEQSELLGTYTLKSGIIFRNVRIGKGPLVTAAPESTTNGSNGSDDKVKPTVVMHVQALLRDGTILMDTRDYGSPIVYELGSALKGMGNIAGVVTPGMDDVISSRGTLVGTKGDKVEPMRQGGIRRAVVPGDLGYGQAGLSQYQVWTLGKTPLRKPVPRNEVIRYEIEILRCMDVALQLPSPDNDNNNNKNKEPIITTAQACCPEDLFPCR